MSRYITYSILPVNERDKFHLSNMELLHGALSILSRDEEINYCSPLVLADAVLCAKIDTATCEAIADSAREVISLNKYHPQSKVASFAAHALLDYAEKTNKSIRDAYSDFLMFDSFTALYQNYYIMHTQTINAAGLGAMRKIARRRGLLEDHGATCNLHGSDVALAELAPDSCKYDWETVGTHLFGIIEDVIAHLDRPLPTDVLSLVAIKIAVEGGDLDSIIQEIPMDEVMQDREQRAHRILDAFFCESKKTEGKDLHDWFYDANNNGLLFASAYVDEDELGHVMDAIEDEHQKVNLLRAENRRKKAKLPTLEEVLARKAK